MLTICFVYQAGEIAQKATYLLESIRKFSSDYTIYLGVPLPTSVYGQIDETKLDALCHQYNAKVLYFENSISHSYKIGNKIQLLYEVSCICTTECLLFLDSDILQVNPFVITEEMQCHDISSKLADVKTYEYSPYLINKYHLPSDRTYMTTCIPEKMTVPYCNAGYIFLSANGCRKEFPKHWLQQAKEIYVDPHVMNKFPWLDQIALPITVHLEGMSINLVSEKYNYPFHIRNILADSVVFCHYHSLDNLHKLQSIIGNT